MRRALPLFAAVAAAVAAAGAGAAGGPTLSVSTTRLAFGSSLTLRGAVPGAAAGEPVQLLSQACGFTSPVAVATATTAAAGTYSFNLEPTLNTIFFVQAADAQSPSTLVTVEPLVQLRRSGPRSYEVNVSVGAGQFFSKKVVLQRYDTRRRQWKTVGSGKLEQASDVGALIAVSAATIHANVKHGTKLRAAVGQATLGECYRPATSAAITA